MANVYEYFDVTGGDQNLSGYAFPEVHKFDASSFYNWEQDNLPINDLETRSDVLKQHLGLGELTGVTLTVSADALRSASSVGVYQTVQEAMAVVPRRLNFPLLIEICDFGDLGDLTIKDIHCEGDGALQIVCRQYGGFTLARANTIVDSSSYGPSATQSMASDFTGVASFITDLEEVSSTKLGINCSSLSAWDYNARVFAGKSPDSQNHNQNIQFAVFPSKDKDSFISGTSTFNFPVYSYDNDNTVFQDADPRIDSSGTSLLTARGGIAQSNYTTAAAFGAYFRKIIIQNCSRIKLQNVCVDSGKGNDYSSPNILVHYCDIGIDIKDSNVLLENVAVMRTKVAGIRAQGSTISSKNNLIVHRIYDRNSAGIRASEGTGIYLVDSNLGFNTSPTGQEGLSLLNVSKCGEGIFAINSRITDGAYKSADNANAGTSSAGNDVTTTRLYIHGNQTGVKLDNSKLDMRGRVEVFCNIKGMDCYQSIAELPQFSVDYNQETGFYLNNSTLIYGKDSDVSAGAIAFSGYNSAGGSPKPAYACDYNKINVHADAGSTVKYADECTEVSSLGMWGGTVAAQGGNAERPMRTHGSSPKPNLLVSNGSHAEMAHTSMYGVQSTPNLAGAGARAEKNSSIVFRGTGTSHTCIGGGGGIATVELERLWTNAGVAAVENSNVVFTGPTKIGGFGVGVLAQTNSKASFGPPTDDFVSWLPDSDKFSLDASANHSNLDVHSARACLVANDKSTIQIYAMGGSSLDADNSVDAPQSFSSVSGTYVSATSGSFVRFSPNGFTELVDTDLAAGTNFNIFTRTAQAINDGSHSGVTTGGMCVRAVGSSKVDVNLTNIKIDAGFAPSLSGVCYNYNGTGCEFDGSVSSGGVSSVTSNLCDLVTNCCLPTNTTTNTSPTTTPTTTTTTTTTTTATTVTGITQPSTLDFPLENAEALENVYIVDNFAFQRAETLTSNYNTEGVIEFSCVGSQIHMWNIADTSRLHAANLLINGIDPKTECVNNLFHGPTGRWYNGAACDYYGKYGFVTSALDDAEIDPTSKTADGFRNLGIFRVVGSHRSWLKLYTEIDYNGLGIVSQFFGGGSPLDQINSQGYQTMFDAVMYSNGAEDIIAHHLGLEPGLTEDAEPVFGRGLAGLPSEPGRMNGVITHAMMQEGVGMLWDSGQLHPAFPIPPLHVGWQGYMRNWLDESAANVFANARHAANKKVNLLSIYKSSTNADIGGEGRDKTTGNPTYGVGVRSLNVFDLNRLV
jgi:hypothetical protein